MSKRRCDKYDAYYDLQTSVWLESLCGSDMVCEFCDDRPDKHSDSCECQEEQGESDEQDN